jgi:5-methyltetrahydropteroyltriglutamate--homocysteine methyltransferase
VQKPVFRADQVGSLLRPPVLSAARKARAEGRASAAELRATEDAAIRDSVTMQEGLGLRVVTDGEFRRENWWIDFVSQIAGVEIRPGETKSFTRGDDHDFRYVPLNVVTTGRLSGAGGITGKDFAALAGMTQATPKITLPSPTRMHFHGGRDAVSATAYPDIEGFFADVVALYRAEIAALEALGCRYIQIDDPLLTYFISDDMRAEVKAAGEDPDQRLARYIRLVNDCVSERRADTRIGVHICRGNSRSGWLVEGGYARIAEQVFGSLDVDSLFLEYDDARSGDFAPLAFVPKGRFVVLGLVTTKFPALEEKDDLRRRVDEAARFVPIENLAVSPQCGFASTAEGNLISPEVQAAKLRLVVETAHAIWGTA